MRNTLFSATFIIMLLATGCGPAAEDREEMHRKAKRFQDSIALYIRQRLAEAEGPRALIPDTSGPRPVQPGAEGH
jgi:hypothetical protein